MKFSPRRPSLRGRMAARTSWKRYARHSRGLKAPRGWGWVTNPKKAAYNRVYSRTTFDVFRPGRRAGGLLLVLIVVAVLVALFGR